MAEIRTNSLVPGLLVELDKDSGVALHAQLEAAVRDAIRDGRLPGGSVVPPSRTLAQELGLSRGVVVEAYQQLTAEGYLVSQTGGYTRVASGVEASPGGTRRDAQPPAHLVDFRYGRPDVSQFPRAAWLRSLRQAVLHTPHDRFNYLDGRGAIEIREALADYLNRVRGTWAKPDDIVVCNGFAQAVALIMPVLAKRGVRRLAIEDPSDSDAPVVATANGLEVVGIPVTAEGIDVGALEASRADAVLLTPAHQFPTGAVLGPEQRTAIVAWARRTGAIIVEDDYDAEHRYDQSPVGALQGLAPDHVIYAGTASKTLAPGLRLGWIIAPPQVATELAEFKMLADRGSPVVDQLAFADFLGRGELDRHLRRMRPFYRNRRDALLRALREELPDFEPTGIAGGIHILAWLPPDLSERDVVDAALERRVFVSGVSPYRIGGAGREGILFGYGKLDEVSIARGVRILAEAVAAVRAGAAS